ncbi:MAG: folylpolyglutamate synthase/dihydrofolate synthase family protein [Cardiobacteriaceae bacterium]|nr:folylpolyglutamate synthase/dihydrofolate synthase family protein [Cardiobacteriaceae bacterium]
MKRTLTEWLTWQENAHNKAWDLGLERIGAVWQALGAPRIAEHIITVAGTNGKGSCVCWTEALCQAHNVSVASFSSPHLHDYRERIRFDGKWIETDELVNAFNAIDHVRGNISLSYFEWSALAAFYCFAQHRPQIAVLEVGLGGRLDATNLIDADVAIITRIGLDHQAWLGHDIDSIAIEKAGIMRPQQRVYFPDAHPPQVLYQHAAALDAQVFAYGRDLRVDSASDGLHLNVPGFSADLPYPPHMHGHHQYGHLTAVLAALAPWIALNTDKVADAIQHAQNPARLMLCEGEPRWLFDVAHNADSAEVLATWLHSLPRRGGKFIALCGMLRDKDHLAIFHQIAPEIDQWVLTSLSGERGTPVQTLYTHALQAGITAEKLVSCDDIHTAYRQASALALPEDTIVVFGSFVTVAAALEEHT